MVAEQVREAVRGDGLLAGDGAVVAMLSGGRDSVCLLDVAVRLCRAGAVHALHVNYGLRPEAGDDERHCRALCEALGVALEVVQARRPGGAGNLQAWAREVRYAEARRLASELEQPGGARTLIATGHTATDQVETILYRLAASPGRRALLGMVAREGRLIRPLLGVSREQTAAYCREVGLIFVEDRSNSDEAFARARVRHGLARALEEIHPAAQSNVLRTAASLREEAEVLEELLEEQLQGQESIAIDRLAELPPALARLVVVRLAERAAGRLVPQAGARVGEILELAARGGRAELHVGGLVGAVVQDGRLRMIRLAPRPTQRA